MGLSYTSFFSGAARAREGSAFDRGAEPATPAAVVVAITTALSSSAAARPTSTKYVDLDFEGGADFEPIRRTLSAPMDSTHAGMRKPSK